MHDLKRRIQQFVEAEYCYNRTSLITAHVYSILKDISIIMLYP